MPDPVTGIGAGVGLLSAGSQSNAAQSAANTQADATRASIDEQRRQADRAYADQAPYRAQGEYALGLIPGLINKDVTAEEVMADPGYQFGMKQGQLGLDRKAAAAGGRISGAALKSAAEYSSNYAANGFNAAYQRRQDRLNRLAALAGVGQTATQASAASGMNGANNISNLTTAQGNAAGGAQLAQGNIWAGATNQIGAAAQKWATPNTNWTPNTSAPSNAQAYQADDYGQYF